MKENIKENWIFNEFPQNCGDSLKVIRKLPIKSGTNYLYECEFQKYPCKVKAQKGHILLGNVNNPLYPTILNIACIGIGKYNFKDYSFIYKRYNDLLRRCYYEKSDRYYCYGAKGVVICDEWKNFQNFAAWYEENSYCEFLSVDKDILANINHLETKIYSPETCLLIPEELNCWFIGDCVKAGIQYRNSNKKFYSEIGSKGTRTWLPPTFSFNESKLNYSFKKKSLLKNLLENEYNYIPNDIKEIILKYDFSWKWVWENMTEEEIINKFYK